jgi:peptidoglycan/LPS O-acetylase OafA/YrhL
MPDRYVDNRNIAMKRSSQERRIHALSIVFAAVPFAFALIRAVRTGYDLRYLWVALASLVGATSVMVVGRAYSRRPHVVVALSAGAFVIATLFAVLAALPLGTKVGPGILIVGSAFGFCCAVSCLLHSLARPRTL